MTSTALEDQLLTEPLDTFYDMMSDYKVPWVQPNGGRKFGYSVFTSYGFTNIRVHLKGHPPFEVASKDPQTAARHWLNVQGPAFEQTVVTWQKAA